MYRASGIAGQRDRRGTAEWHGPPIDGRLLEEGEGEGDGEVDSLDALPWFSSV